MQLVEMDLWGLHIAFHRNSILTLALLASILHSHPQIKQKVGA
jgi:hypothetical protein